MELVEEFDRIIDALEQGGVDYAVCGGVALAIHGHPRATKDIDLLVLDRDRAKALEVVNKVEYALEVGRITFKAGKPEERSVFRVSRASGAHFMTPDLLLISDPESPLWIERERTQWRGKELVVVSREGLIEMKRPAAR
jgi:hypothetical protein